MFIRTAFGIAGPISISGVTKQGGPLSPIKSTLTTSLGHRYLDDLAAKEDGTVILQTRSRLDMREPHTPIDESSVRVTMVEATDDSYIFATDLQTLQKYCLQMERFQYAYGWLTQWKKSAVSILGTIPNALNPPPESIRMPSITNLDGRDPLEITYHDVQLKVGELEFLKAMVDDPVTRARLIRNLIENFVFPKFSIRTPITLIRKIIMQCIASRCRALLSIQPIKQQDAEAIDKLIASKIHMVSGFPYTFLTDILYLPIENHGLGFPSIARMNMAICIEGLIRDLNHQVPAYRKAALVTFSDWMCVYNQCINPTDRTGLQREFVQYYNRIPAAWITAQKGMRNMEPPLTIRQTDLSYIWEGKISLTHTLNLCNRNMDIKLDKRAVNLLEKSGLRKLHMAATWQTDQSGTRLYPSQTLRSMAKDNKKKTALSRHCRTLASILPHIAITWFCQEQLECLVDRETRRR